MIKDIKELREHAKEIAKECEVRGYSFDDAELLAHIFKDEVKKCNEATKQWRFPEMKELVFTERIKTRNQFLSITEVVANFLKAEKEEAEKAAGKEENKVCINPNSYIAKEIKYQSALLHQILDEIRKRGAM